MPQRLLKSINTYQFRTAHKHGNIRIGNLSWRLARIIKTKDGVILTVPDVPSIRVETATLEQAMEIAQRELDAYTDACRAHGRTMPRVSTIKELHNENLDAVYGLLEKPCETTLLMETSASRRTVQNRRMHAASARFQLGSLLARSRIRNTTSPCLFVTSRRQPGSSESP